MASLNNMRRGVDGEVELMIPNHSGNSSGRHANKIVAYAVADLEENQHETETDDQHTRRNSAHQPPFLNVVRDHKFTKWQVVFGVQLLLFIWLFVMTIVMMTSSSSSPSPAPVPLPPVLPPPPPPSPPSPPQDPFNGMMTLTQLSHNTTSLDIKADVIRMIKPTVYSLEGVMRNGARAWSIPALNVYVGDSLSWTWTTNENVVECTKDGLIRAKNDRYIDSGELKSGGTYIKEFTVPNAYYFCSENSQTLTGKVVVFEQPTISIKRERFIGPITAVPTGIKNDLTVQDLEIMDGCWKSCYTKNTELSNSFNYDTVVAECTGDYIFMGVATSAAPDKYTIGAFGRKAVVFSNAMTTSSYSSVSSVPTVLENGAYWFRINNPSYGHYTVGFALSGTLTTSSTQLVYCYNLAQCGQCLSYGFTSGSHVGCSSTVDKTASHKRVFLTNTCPLTMPPGSV